MAPDQAPAAAPLPAVDPSERTADKFRLRFRKGGPLRFLSHHDLMRTFERMLRRADLPFRRSQGFHPKPRLVFALSLPLGVVGREEVVELELDETLPPEEVRSRLMAQAPPGLEVGPVRRIDLKAGAQVRSLCYGLAVPAGRVHDLRRRIDEVMTASECLVDRTRPPRRRIDLRPFLRDLSVLDAEAEGEPGPAGRAPFLEVSLWLTPAGTARPDEVLALLGLADLLDAGAVLERTRLELFDEAPAAEGQGPLFHKYGIHDQTTQRPVPPPSGAEPHRATREDADPTAEGIA
jgi:radical SAM-linked protein